MVNYSLGHSILSSKETFNLAFDTACCILDRSRFSDSLIAMAETPTRALCVRKPWCDLILSGDKDIELRSMDTSIRGRICIAQSGTSELVGEVDLIDSFLIATRDINGVLRDVPPHSLEGLFGRHRVNVSGSDASDVIHGYKRVFAWVLANASRYETPRRYHHPVGAVRWVNLKPQESAIKKRRVTTTTSQSSGHAQSLDLEDGFSLDLSPE